MLLSRSKRAAWRANQECLATKSCGPAYGIYFGVQILSQLAETEQVPNLRATMPAKKKNASPAKSARLITASKDLVADVALANLILFDHDILDGFGHVSARHDKDPERFIMARYVPPGIVTPGDIREFGLDSEAVPDRGEKHYSERFIHGEIYKARPDVNAIIHSHAPPLIPFGATGAALRPMYHMSAHVGLGVPVFEIREFQNEGQMLIRSAYLGRSLASVLADKPMVLMRGHGATIVAPSLHLCVYRAI